MIPQYRIEQYLNAINAAYLGDSPLPEYPAEPVWRIEGFLAAILSAVKGDSPVMACPDPVWHIEEFARAIYDALVGASPAWPCPTATNNIEAILHAIYKVVADGTETDGIATSWDIERWLLDSYDAAKEGGGTKVTGNAPLTLANALASEIKRLVQTGLCAQASTPTLADSVDIYCNRGKLTAVDGEVVVVGPLATGNLFDPSKRTDGKRLNAGGLPYPFSSFSYSDPIPVEYGKTYSFFFKGIADQTNHGVLFYTNADAPSNENYVKQEGVIGLVVGNCGGRNDITVDDESIHYARLNYATEDENVCFMEGTGPYVPYMEGECIEVQSQCPNLVNEETNITGYYISSSGNISVGADAQYTDLIPVIPGETYTWSLISNRPSGGNNRWHGYNADGTWKKQIAYKSTGAGVGIPFELTATIPYDISYVRLSYGIDDEDVDFSSAYSSQYATAEPLLAVGDVKDEQDIISGRVTRRCAACVYDGTQPVGENYISTTGGKDVGAIIVYPLETPTTESVTPQPLNVTDGTNVIDVTAEVSPIALDVVYKAANNG